MLGLLLLAAGAASFLRQPKAGHLLPDLGVAALFPLVPLVQLIPLPPFLWASLPGHGMIADELRLIVSSLPWRPITLSTEATRQALFSLAAPLAVFIATLLLSYWERRLVSCLILGFGVLSVILGMAQLAGGQYSPLRFYQFTDTSEAVGFFANRNHFSAFLYCLLPIAAAWVVGLGLRVRRSRRSHSVNPQSLVAYLSAIAVFTVLLFAQGLVRSRAGLAITIVAATVSLALAFPYRDREVGARVVKGLFGSIAVAIVLVALFALFRILQRFDVDPVDDLRWVILKGSVQALRLFFPVGAGLGTFDVVYPMFEQPGNATVEYINRAHDDFIEATIESGALAPVVLVIFLIWLGRTMRRAWGAASMDLSSIDASLARAGTFVPILLLFHSALDYPLRTDALMAVTAFACAVAVPPIAASPEESEIRPARKRRLRREYDEGAVVEQDGVLEPVGVAVQRGPAMGRVA